MGLTVTQLEANLTLANDAYALAVKAKQYTHGSRSKHNQELAQLREDITHWSKEIARAERSNRIPVRGITTV